MIPIKLEVTNFLSYRETAVLEFNSIQTACISGPNGAGKSSILDSITWALFGQSRSKSDDDVVNRLAASKGDEATVRFTFALEGTQYRVSRSKGLRKSTRLELQVSAGDGKWKALTESKIRETQGAIETLLRMNYDTFTNASFLLQGHADEFTTKTPNRRKEILADLLGLGIWDAYRERAAARRKEEESQLLILDSQLAEIEAELGEAEARQAEVAAAQEVLAQVQSRLDDKEALLRAARRAETAVQQQKQMVQNLAMSLARAQRRLADLEQSQQQRQAERDEHTAVLAQAEQIEAEFAAWQAADSQLQAWQEKADAYNRLLQAKRPHELAIAQERSRLEQRLQALQAQAERVARADEERADVQKTLAEAEAQLEKLSGEWETAVAQEAAWQEKRAELQRLEAERAAQQQELQRLQNQAKRMETLQAEQSNVLQNRQEAAERLEKIQKEMAQLAEVKTQHQAYVAEKTGLEQSQPALREEFRRQKARIQQLEEETGGQCPLCGQTLTAAHRQNVLAELQTQHESLETRGKANKDRLAWLDQEIGRIDTQLQQEARLDQDIQTQRTRQATADARLNEINQSLADWEAEGAKRLAELETAAADKATIETLKQEMAELYTAVQQKARLEEQRQTQQRLLANQEARLAELDRLLADWAESEEAALTAVQVQLDEEDYAQEAQAALVEIDEQLTALAYDEAVHEAARQARQALAEAPQRQQALQRAQAAVKPLEDTLADLARQLSEQAEVVQETEAQHETAVAELAGMEADGSDVKKVEDEVFALREEQQTANRRVAVAQNRLDVLDDLKVRKQTLTEMRASQTRLIQRLKQLERACSRDGVQALLIEQALPEIEDSANALLERLTGGDMRVSFETQRQLKSRDALAETLDIRIQDYAGERPYENFSGGEQFRVNFAIRLALSQLLARRAGARLQTLVIDEGFGSQDPNGRQRLVEAINTIRDDFAVILVITHIDELRDHFPVRIEVEKRPSGSAVRVI